MFFSIFLEYIVLVGLFGLMIIIVLVFGVIFVLMFFRFGY